MTHRQFLKLCDHPPKGKLAPKPVLPAEKPYHPERLKDPRWQWKPFRKGGFIDRLRATGQLDEAKLQAHFDKTLCPSDVPAPR